MSPDKVRLDTQAEILDVDMPRISVMEEDDFKELESNYFKKITIVDTLLFGGTLAKNNGGVTAFALAANGKYIAEATSNGSILVYDTEEFNLIRLFEGNSHTKYVHIEFSSDNVS